MRSTSDNHPRSALAIRHFYNCALVLETLVRGERFPGSIDPFSSIPARSRALQRSSRKTCPMTDRCNGDTGVLQQPWDEGRSARFNCQSLVPIAPVADWRLLAERESTADT